MKTSLNKLLLCVFIGVLLNSCEKNVEIIIPYPYDKVFKFTDPRDNREYSYIVIGEQEWMMENLAYLPQVDDATAGSEDTSGAYYYVYNYTPSGTTELDEIKNAKATDYYKTFGVLYNFQAAQNICPTGWHLPSDEEWTILEIFLQNNGYNSPEEVAGTQIIIDTDNDRNTNNFTNSSLSSVKYWENWDTDKFSPKINRNKSRFNGIPGGKRSYYEEGVFVQDSIDAYYWTSTEVDSSKGTNRKQNRWSPQLHRETPNKSEGFSVRCVKDKLQ
jgi:uncharacterized protein (TIGR02145 family)